MRGVGRPHGPQRQSDLEDGVVEEEHALGDHVREVRAVAPGARRRGRGRGAGPLGDGAGGRGDLRAAQGEDGGRDEGEGVAEEQVPVDGGRADAQGRRRAEAAEGPAGVGDRTVDGLVADALAPGDAGGVELGQDARRAVAETAGRRAGQQQGEVLGDEEAEGGQGAQELEGGEDAGEGEAVGQPAAQRRSRDAGDARRRHEGAHLGDAEVGDVGEVQDGGGGPQAAPHPVDQRDPQHPAPVAPSRYARADSADPRKSPATATPCHGPAPPFPCQPVMY